MHIIEMSMRRPLTIIVLVFGIILAAGIALQKMPRDVFPPLNVPTIYLVQPYGGMDPAQIEGYITYRYEYYCLYLTGLEHVESKSIQGAALIKLQFHPGTDMTQAMTEIGTYANRARASMPAGTVPPFIMRFDAGSVPVGNLVFTSESRTVVEIQDAVLNKVRPLFATLPGVSAPPPIGSSARTILINVKTDRLREYNVTLDEIVSAIASANTISPSGNLNLGDSYPIVSLNSVVRNIKDLEAVPIKTGVYPAVFVRDLAEIIDGSDITTCYADVNGRRTVYIPVTKRADASTLTVVNLVKKNIPKFQEVLPEGVNVSYEFDQSTYVISAISGLSMEAVLGALLSGLMVLLFLRDWRSALVVVLNIPIALFGAVFALWLTGQTINLMTLGGLTLAVGILVDMSTVAIENIHTHMDKGKSVTMAVAGAGKEVSLPLLIAMLCILAVFIPSLFMEGAARALFVPLALAVGFSMLTAYLLANTLVPVLSSWILRKHPIGETNRHGVFARFQSGYRALLKRSMSLRWVTVIAYPVISLGVIYFVGGTLGEEIFPRVNSNQLQIRMHAVTGTRVDKTEAMALRALDIIKQTIGGENIAINLAFVGVHPSSYPTLMVYQWNGGPEEGILQVQLKDTSKVDIVKLRETLRSEFARQMPEASFSFEPIDIINRVMSFGANTPIDIAVVGSKLTDDREFAEKLRIELAKLPDLRDLQFGQTLDYPTVKVDIDREKAGLMGVKTADLGRTLTAAVASSRFTTPMYWADPNSGVAYEMQVQIPKAQMNSLEEVKNLPVASNSNKTVALRSVAEVSNSTMVGQYERYNMQRLISITANIEGSDLGHMSAKINQAIAAAGPPPSGVIVIMRGQVPIMNSLLSSLQSGLWLAILVIFLLLAANFQSLRLAMIVIVTAPAVIAGVALTLYLTGTTVNIQSFIGTIMAIGVAVANAILLVTFAERSRIAGHSASEAAVEGASSRLRPILMTSLAMIAGMLPMAMGLGESGEQTAPLGLAVIGGLIAATLTTLWLVPAVFTILRNRASTHSRSLDPNDPLSGHYVSPIGND